MNFLKYIAKMLSQPSSYAGLSGIAVAFGVSQPAYAALSAALAGVFGAIAFFLDGNKLTN